MQNTRELYMRERKCRDGGRDAAGGTEGGNGCVCGYGWKRT